MINKQSIFESIRKYDTIVRNKKHAWEWPTGHCKYCYNIQPEPFIEGSYIRIIPGGYIQHGSRNPRCNQPSGTLNFSNLKIDMETISSQCSY